jgi:hypothetical protein
MTTTPSARPGAFPGNGRSSKLLVEGNDEIQIIEAVQVENGTGALSWKSFNASNYIPLNATAVILEARAQMSNPDSGNDVTADIRR